MVARRKSAKMADPSVAWCGRLSPGLHVQPWSPAAAAEPAEAPPLPEPDPAIERLLALYTAGAESQALIDDDADASQSSSASEEILSNQDLTLDKALIARDLLGECDVPADADDLQPAAKRLCRAPAELTEPAEPPPPPPAEQAAAEEPCWRKTVRVGPGHQAELPPLRPPAGRRRARPSGDRLLWDPRRLSELEVERYQRRLPSGVASASVCCPAAPPAAAAHPPDHEQALRHLQESGHDVTEALRRLTPDQLRPPGRLSHWSEQECLQFEQALRLHGKDFHAIQRQQLPTRSVGEIVNFYYLWKKTERHRQFLSLTKLDKRKYGPDWAVCESAAPSSLQILMATDPWQHGAWGIDGESATLPPPPAALISLLASCPHLLQP